MPLFVITGVTALNTTFFIGFTFMAKEGILQYNWVLSQLKEMYEETGITTPSIILTDHDKSLIAGIQNIFPSTV